MYTNVFYVIVSSWKYIELLLQLIFPVEISRMFLFGLINCDDFHAHSKHQFKAFGFHNKKKHTQNFVMWKIDICHYGVASLGLVWKVTKKWKRNLEMNCIYLKLLPFLMQYPSFSNHTLSTLLCECVCSVYLSFPLISCSLCDCFSLYFLMCSHHFVRRYDFYEYEHRVPHNAIFRALIAQTHTRLLARSLAHSLT